MIARTRPERDQGFSLVEVMITVLIVGLLAAVALPAYKSHLRKSRNAEIAVRLGYVAQEIDAFKDQNAYVPYDLRTIAALDFDDPPTYIIGYNTSFNNNLPPGCSDAAACVTSLMRNPQNRLNGATVDAIEDDACPFVTYQLASWFPVERECVQQNTFPTQARVTNTPIQKAHFNATSGTNRVPNQYRIQAVANDDEDRGRLSREYFDKFEFSSEARAVIALCDDTSNSRLVEDGRGWQACSLP